MKKLIITKKDNYKYTLKDMENNEYQFNIEFYNIEKNPEVGDYLYISEKILQENNTFLNFGSLESEYGRKIESANDDDIVALIVNGEKIYLKRVYG